MTPAGTRPRISTTLGRWRGGMVLFLFLLVAGLAPGLSLPDPNAQNLVENLRPASAQHPLGQDRLGRDLLSRLVFGARASLAVGLLVCAISVSVGTLTGAVAGYRGGWVDALFLYITDVLLAFPGVLLIVGLATVLGPSLGATILVLSATGWTGYARLVRGLVRVARAQDFVTAVVALGAGPTRVLWRHLLPGALPSLLVQATFGTAGVILSEAGLSFLGLGIQPPTPSWGGMIQEGRTFLLIAPHLAMAPGIALMLLVWALNDLGERLRMVLRVGESTSS